MSSGSVAPLAMVSSPSRRKSVPGSWMEMGGGILSGHRSPILTSAICDQLTKICSPNSDLKYIKIYVEDISQFFYFSTLVKIGPNKWYMSFCCFVCPDNVSWSRFRVFVSLSLSVHVSRSALCVGQFFHVLLKEVSHCNYLLRRIVQCIGQFFSASSVTSVSFCRPAVWPCPLRPTKCKTICCSFFLLWRHIYY